MAGISFQFTEAARRYEECTLGAQAANKRSSRKLEDMLVFHVLLPDNSTDGETKHQLNNAGLQAAQGNSKKKHFTFLAKFQKRTTSIKASEASPCRISFHASLLLSGEILVRECIKLARRTSRTAAVCFSPSLGADEDDLPYMQLDKVTHALTRDAFGPLYLVT